MSMLHYQLRRTGSEIAKCIFLTSNALIIAIPKA